MIETERAFAARALTVGWKQAFLEYFADDAVGFERGMADLAREQIQAQSRSAERAAADLGATLRRPRRQRRTRLSHRAGEEASCRAATRASPRHSTYFSVWKQQRNGSYRVVLDVGTTTPMAPPFAPGFTRATAHQPVHRRLRRAHAAARHRGQRDELRTAHQPVERLSRAPGPWRPACTGAG